MPIAEKVINLPSQPFKPYTQRHMSKIEALAKVPADMRFEMEVVANVLPFRVNNHVLEELIDWDNVPDDPMFRLLFPQKEMLKLDDFNRVAALMRREAPKAELNKAIYDIRQSLNPHPAGQMELNVPKADEQKLEGIQHKYDQTVLFFPAQGQVCHSYCTFCFRWAQFVGDKDLKFLSKENTHLLDYLRSHKEVSDLLITGGDPMVMKTKHLQMYLDGILDDDLSHVQTIRIGTKSLTFWPDRYLNDADADDLLRFLESLIKAGKHVALMAHINHWQELQSPKIHLAVERLRNAGIEIRTQAPLLNHINADASVWARMWREQVRMGMIPYYMFVERDTGAQHYFEVPLVKAATIYRDAMQQVSGLARTARGPSMSADPGKIEIQGITEIKGEKVMVLRFIQGRNSDWVQRPFFAKYDENATWLNHLKPAFGEERFFYEDDFDLIKKYGKHGIS